jgi:hypothetical protein
MSSEEDFTEYSEGEQQDVLFDVLYDYFNITLDDIPNQKALFDYCKEAINEFIRYEGGTMEVDYLIDTISKFLIGMDWPRYCDGNEYKIKFDKALKLYKQYIRRLKYLYVYMNIGELSDLNQDVINYMKKFV